MDAETFKKVLAPLLKANGFERSGATWRRGQIESIAVLNIQKSRWGNGVFYINLGTYFRKLGGETLPAENKCHVRRRLEIDTPAEVADVALAWFNARAASNDAASLAEADSTKGLVFKEVRNAGRT